MTCVLDSLDKDIIRIKSYIYHPIIHLKTVERGGHCLYIQYTYTLVGTAKRGMDLSIFKVYIILENSVAE